MLHTVSMTPPDGTTAVEKRDVRAVAGSVLLPAGLSIPGQARGVVVLVNLEARHHRDPENEAIAHLLTTAGLAVVVLDVLTPEEASDAVRRDAVRHDLPVLARRIGGVTDWLAVHPWTQGLPIAYFGIGALAAPAMITAAVERNEAVRALVVCDGRLDLADAALERLHAPILAIVGSCDRALARLNEEALQRITATSELEVIPERISFQAPDIYTAQAPWHAQEREWVQQWLAAYMLPAAETTGEGGDQTHHPHAGLPSRGSHRTAVSGARGVSHSDQLPARSAFALSIGARLRALVR